MNGIAAGALAQRMTVETRTQVSDGHDGFTESWEALKSRIAARVRPLVGRDLERARQIDPRVSHEVTLRYWADYRTDLNGGRARLVWHDGASDVQLEIVAPPVDVEAAHEQLTLLCRELA